VRDLVDALAGARVYDLGRPLEATTPTSPNHPPFRMALLRRHGDVVRPDGMSGANELLTMSGHTGTHIDALAHVSSHGKLHGGLDAVEASRGGRFKELGVETIKPMLARGILLDVPRALGCSALEEGHAITAEELRRTAAAQGTEPAVGDVVLIRTGWPVGRYENNAAYAGHVTGVPGPDLSGARWLSERRLKATGSDTIAFEHIAPGAGHSLLPVHTHLLFESGIHIFEVLDLEALAEEGVHEFLFIAIPLKLVGATGSPVRPLAVVVA
jgi:kynurenine formamidase